MTLASFAYGQASQTNSNNANSNIQNIPAKKVHVGDIDVAYKMFGKGDPILLVSGASSDMNAWEPSTLRGLSSNHTVIIFDNRGVGNTTTGTKPFSVQQLANDTAGLLDALKIQKADVLGYSLGSLVAQQLTVTHPEKVNRLILIARLLRWKREYTGKSSSCTTTNSVRINEVMLRLSYLSRLSYRFVHRPR